MTVFNSIRREASRTLWLLRSTTHKVLKMTLRRESSFVPKRVLLLQKVSQYDFEQLREPKLNETEIKRKLLDRGSDFQAILDSHWKNKTVVTTAIETLENMNIKYKVADRMTIDQADFDWADLVLAIGGDGTFLLGANLIHDNKKPILGINSDPQSSEGYLMLSECYTKNIPKIFEKLKNGHFEYLMRTRIRVTLRGAGIWNSPFHMHEKGRILGQEKYRAHYTEKTDVSTDNCIQNFRNYDKETSETEIDPQKERRLPWLALNEVFIGESMSARTSSLNIRIGDEKKFHKVKSSGLCISTGTGSSSWYRAINSLTNQTVKDILKVVEPKKTFDDQEVDKICTEFNDRLEFPADDPKISYAIRDIIINEIWPLPKNIAPRGFCTNLTVQSQCYDAGLVLDGGIGIPFNVGTTAFLEINPEDALKTIIFDK